MSKRTTTMRALLLLTFSSVALLAPSGCAMTVNEPSLAPREVERLTVSEPAPQPQPPVIPEDASQQQRVAALVAQGREGDARFKQQLGVEDDLIIEGARAPAGSEAWVQAQLALSRLETLRNAIALSLADLEGIQIAAVQNGAEPESMRVLGDAVNEITAIDAGEEQALQALRDQLSAP